MADVGPDQSAQPGHEPTPRAERDWFSGRRWTGIGAIGVLVVVALCVGLLVFPRRGDQRSSPPTASGTPTTSAPAVGDQQIPTAPPSDVTWSLYQSVALPSSPGAGPHTVFGDAATGYAHTPTGALVAAAQISTRRLLALDVDWRASLTAMVAPGPGREAFARSRSSVSHPQPDPPGTYNQLAGFNFLSYTPTDAVIQLVSKTPGGTLQVVPEHLAWLENDWKLVLAPDGGEASSAQRLESLDGFVPWSGV